MRPDVDSFIVPEEKTSECLFEAIESNSVSGCNEGIINQFFGVLTYVAYKRFERLFVVLALSSCKLIFHFHNPTNDFKSLTINHFNLSFQLLSFSVMRKSKIRNLGRLTFV